MGDGGHTVNKLDFNELFTTGWQKFMAQIGPAILWTLLFAVGEVILCAIVVGIIVLPVWMAGYLEIMKKLYHGETPEFGDFFKHMNKLGNLWVAFLLVGLGTALGMVLLVIPGIALSVLWSMTFFLIIDKDMDAISAMKASFERVKDEFWMMLALILVLGIINAIGGVIYIGVLVTAPFMMFCIWAAYYVLFPKAEAYVPPAGTNTPTMPLQ
jgi:uncharacterized membrane protein